MSNVELIIEERAADIGNFLVGRLLPFRQKRSVGPFVFIDHMGPANFKNGDLDVGPHPHIGLSTLTFLFDGTIKHRDSLGTAIEIRPGAVNWMTAGKGVVHSERTPDELRGKDHDFHGLQIWVALPKELENSEASFHHIAADDLPTWEEEGLKFKLVAGKVAEHASPVPVHSELYMIEIKSGEKGGMVNIGDRLFGESGLYILEGGIREGGNEYGPKQILIAKDATLCAFEIDPNSTIYIFGGTPFPEPRYIFWNFVSSEKETIEKAKQDWMDKKFPKVPGDDDYVPLPHKLKNIKPR